MCFCAFLTFLGDFSVFERFCVFLAFLGVFGLLGSWGWYHPGGSGSAGGSVHIWPLGPEISVSGPIVTSYICGLDYP